MAVLTRETTPAWREATAGIVAFGLGATLLAALLARSPSAAELIAGTTFGAVLVVIAALDVLTLRAPNRIVYPAVGGFLAAAAFFGPADLVNAIAGGAAAFLVLLLVALLSRDAMGYGDVKVGGLCGVATGVGGVLPMLAGSFLAGGAFAAVVLALRLRGRRDPVAFTPFLVIGVAWAFATGNGYLVS